jgi:hypothetical protein
MLFGRPPASFSPLVVLLNSPEPPLKLSYSVAEEIHATKGLQNTPPPPPLSLSLISGDKKTESWGLGPGGWLGAVEVDPTKV